MSATPLKTSGKRQIPECEFVEDVVSYVKQYDSTDDCLRHLEVLIQKYRFMEQNLEQQRAALAEQMPELRKSLDMVILLKEKKAAGETAFDYKYNLADQVHASARINNIDHVILSLGCEVFVEHTLDEAETLLTSQLGDLKNVIDDLSTDLAFIARQITTASVTLSRVYNHDVATKRK